MLKHFLIFSGLIFTFSQQSEISDKDCDFQLDYYEKSLDNLDDWALQSKLHVAQKSYIIEIFRLQCSIAGRNCSRQF